MKKEVLLQIFPEDELALYNSMIPPGKTALWKYWEEFIEMRIRVHRSHESLKNTRDAIRYIVRHAETYTLEEFDNPGEITTRLLNMKDKRGICSNTYNTYLKNLKSYFIYLVRQEIIPENKLDKVEKDKGVVAPQPTLSESEVKIINGAMEKGNSQLPTIYNLRNLILVRLFILTGARPGELLSIKDTNFEFDKSSLGSVLRLQGSKQNNKLRPYELDTELTSIIRAYQHEKQLNGKEIDYFFISASHKGPLTKVGIRNLFRGLSKQLGFYVTPYGFRRFVATKLHQSEVPIATISLHLGHTNTKTTNNYIERYSVMNKEGTNIMNMVTKSEDIASKSNLLQENVQRNAPSNTRHVEAEVASNMFSKKSISQSKFLQREISNDLSDLERNCI